MGVFFCRGSLGKPFHGLSEVSSGVFNPRSLPWFDRAQGTMLHLRLCQGNRGWLVGLRAPHGPVPRTSPANLRGQREELLPSPGREVSLLRRALRPCRRRGAKPKNMTNGNTKNHLPRGLIHPILARIRSFLQECLIMQRAPLRSPFWQVPAVV